MAVPDLADCKPGIDPTEFNIIIAPETAETVTAGGIILLDNSKEAKDMASMIGRLVKVAPLAFSYAKAEEWGDARKPRPGDRVLFGKYAGVLVKGDDEREYRVCKDADIIAVFEEPAHV
jgi:co-chaperonin GroES (HSP10)